MNKWTTLLAVMAAGCFSNSTSWADDDVQGPKDQPQQKTDKVEQATRGITGQRTRSWESSERLSSDAAGSQERWISGEIRGFHHINLTGDAQHWQRHTLIRLRTPEGRYVVADLGSKRDHQASILRNGS